MSAVWLLALPRHSDTLSGTHTGALEVRLVATATIASNIQRPTSNVVRYLTASKSGFSQIWSVSDKAQSTATIIEILDHTAFFFLLHHWTLSAKPAQWYKWARRFTTEDFKTTCRVSTIEI